MRAISAFSLLAGMSTRACFAVTALRMRESMSEIGSVILASLFSSPLTAAGCQLPSAGRSRESGARSRSPATLRHARDVAFQRQFPEAEAAHRELPHVGARPSAQPAPVAQTNPVLRYLGFLRNLRGCRHL